MSSPAKKRKLNSSNKAAQSQSRGLEYFFPKQKQAETPDSSNSRNSVPGDAAASTLTDEELARKLQAEWDKEIANEGQEQENKDLDEKKELSEIPGLLSTSKLEPQRSTEMKGLLPTTTHMSGNGKRTLTLQAAGMAEDAITTSIPFDEPPLTFEASKYAKQLQEHWATDGGDASYALLTRCFVLVSSTTSRIKIVDTLVNCLRVLIEGDPASLLPAVSSL